MTDRQTVSPGASGLTPQTIIQTYSASDWEAFIEEWSEGFEPPYVQVVRLAGPGDKGRDVAAHLTDPAVPHGAWDNYQCKHYDHPLHPTDAYLELGKLCLYSFEGAYTTPRRYRFAAPRSVGVALYDLIRNPETLKARLIDNWDKYCRRKITSTREVPLDGGLKQYVQDFDFTIVGFLTPTEMITQHQRTKYWPRRFKIDRPDRPTPQPVPDAVQTHELRYVSSLLDAYAEFLQRPVAQVDDISGDPALRRHFTRAREYFFSAEALGRFSRDHFAPDAFDTVKQHVFDGIIDTVEGVHPNGFARVNAVTELAVAVQLPASDLEPFVEPRDRKGLCHHLANDGKVRWCHRAE